MSKTSCTSIDAVYTWVNGMDPVHRNKYAYWKKRHGSLSDKSAGKHRFWQRNELRYSLRSIATFAPWINNIYIVTDRQVPKWLHTDCPQVHIVDHADILPEKALPTFNSNAIETYLHTIPNLSEHFLYFNDDFFLGNDTTPETFFTKDGTIKIQQGSYVFPDGPIQKTDSPFVSSLKKSNQLLNTQFYTEERNVAHQVYPLRRSVMEHLWNMFPKSMEQTNLHRFRSSDDVVTPLCLHPYTALYTKKGVLCDENTTIAGFELTNNLEKNQRNYDSLLLKRPSLFCINDKTTTFDIDVLEDLEHFLSTYFPTPSPYELHTEST